MFRADGFHGAQGETEDNQRQTNKLANQKTFSLSIRRDIILFLIKALTLFFFLAAKASPIMMSEYAKRTALLKTTKYWINKRKSEGRGRGGAAHRNQERKKQKKQKNRKVSPLGAAATKSAVIELKLMLQRVKREKPESMRQFCLQSVFISSWGGRKTSESAILKSN